MWRPSGRLRNPESKSCCEFRLMQIITDIIEYLDERGLLSASDIAYLRQSGVHTDPGGAGAYFRRARRNRSSPSGDRK
jgi:hypothetical protein